MRHWWNHLIDRRRQSGVHRLGMAALAVALVALTLSGVSVLAGPQPSGPVARHTHGGHPLAVGGAIPRALTRGIRGAREDGARPLTLMIALQAQHRAALEQLILDQHNPKSAHYQKYLSPQAFADQFGGAPAAVAAVRAFLQGAGFHVTGVSANRLQITATGTVAQAERAFVTTISQYQLDKRTVYAPDTAPVVPDALAASVVGIIGLDNIAVFHAQQQSVTHGPAHPTHPASGPAGGFDPTELRGAYGVAALIGAGGTGSGQRVGVFELAPYLPGDLTAYRTQFGLPAAAVNTHSVDGALVTCTAGASCDTAAVSEADLDVEVVSALAPSATQDVYTGPNSGTGVLHTYQAIATDNVAKVVTTSWGICEQYAGNAFLIAQDNIFIQAASQGQTIYAASGDTGSDDCRTGGSSVPTRFAPAVDSPASDPYVVGVGGTSLTIAPTLTYGDESAWNDTISHGVPIATGGGVSTFFSRPTWQQGTSMPTAQPQLRLVPDVSANADPYTGYAVYCTDTVVFTNGGCQGVGWLVFGGTSAAAPLWAGLTADMNTYLLANAKPAVGWINTTLYQLLGNSQTNFPFHDVNGGNNIVNITPGYSAGACFDEVTGAGSPDAWSIARDIQGGIATGGGGACPIPTPPASTNLIQNGGFENATIAPWQESSQSGFEAVISGVPLSAHSGSAAFFACAYPSCDDRIWQVVSVPASVSTATLVFWIDANSWLAYSTPALANLDRLYVTLAWPDGTVIPNPVVVDFAENSYGYRVVAANVTDILRTHLNQQIIVQFRGVTSGLAGDRPFYSSWAVDDVSLIVT